MKSISSIAAVALIVACTTSGCSSTRPYDAPPGGFLADLDGLREVVDPLHAGGRVYVKEPGILARYDRILVEPVVVVFDPDTPARMVDPEDLARLTRSLRERVTGALREGGYEVVDTAGPGVLRIRAALTHVDASRPVANIAGKAAGTASGIGGLVVPTLDLGGAAIEAEMIDGDSGTRVAAYRDARRGRRFGGTMDASRRWGHAEDAFDVWAEELRERLDAVRDQKT